MVRSRDGVFEGIGGDCRQALPGFYRGRGIQTYFSDTKHASLFGPAHVDKRIGVAQINQSICDPAVLDGFWHKETKLYMPFENGINYHSEQAVCCGNSINRDSLIFLR